MLARVASAAWRSFGGKTAWSSDALQRRRQEPRGNTLYVLGHLVFHIRHPTENRSILPHSSGNCWTQHLYPPRPLAGNPFPFRPCLLSGTYSFSSRLQREFQEGGFFAWSWSWYHTLSLCRQGFVSFFFRQCRWWLRPISNMLEWAFCVLWQRALAAPLSKRVCETAQCELHTQHPAAKASTRCSFWARSQRICRLHSWDCQGREAANCTAGRSELSRKGLLRKGCERQEWQDMTARPKTLEIPWSMLKLSTAYDKHSVSFNFCFSRNVLVYEQR